MTSIEIGTRFTRRSERTYREDGERKVFAQTVLAEVVSIDAVGFEWRVVEVLAETDRPGFDQDSRPTGGSTAWFGWDAAVARGDVKVV
jgi:hypothetical protein